MALRHHTLLVALAVAVVALAAPAHADNGSDPCWLWRGLMPETFEHYYFNLTAFTSEQRGEAKNDDDIVYVASLCNYTKGHSSTRTSSSPHTPPRPSQPPSMPQQHTTQPTRASRRASRQRTSSPCPS